MAKIGSYNGRNLPMTTLIDPYLPFRDGLRFQRAGAIRAVSEAALGCAILLLVARLLGLTGDFGRVLANVPDLFSLLWLWTLPAWTLQPIARPWPVRIPIAMARAIVLGLILTGIGALLISVLNPGVLRLSQMPEILLWFVVLRLLFDGGAAVLQRVRRRLRWQLLVSHASVIALTLVTITAGGTLFGLLFVLTGITPRPVGMATSVANNLSLSGAITPHDSSRMNQVLGLIYSRRLTLRGEPPLAGFNPAVFLPKSIVVADLNGRILAGRTDLGNDGKRTRPATWADLGNTRASWSRVRSFALSGRAVRLGEVDAQAVAEAPVRNASGAVTAVALVRTTDYRPNTGQIIRILATAFGVGSLILILVMAVPGIAVSFLVSYLVARGLTRRLESLSTVATAIASGDLEKRAPTTSSNEVGRLASDVNHMADHLQTTMAELEGARAQAEEELRLRRRLIADISHELRTPLATIRAHLESVQLRHSIPAGRDGGRDEIVLPAATSEALQVETARLESMVDDLFALSRAEAGAIEVRAEPVDVAALIREIADRMRPLAQREGGIALSADVTDGSIVALADADRLHQIVSNLVRNAVRHTPDGGIIVLSATRQGEWVVLGVADTGEGIPSEDLPHVFERFYRSDPARSRATGGAGLGLAIVREFVQLMGGRVEVESTVREGTRFRVFLRAAD